MDLIRAASCILKFQNLSLRETISDLETAVIGHTAANIADLCLERNVSQELWDASHTLKELAGQINVIIHAIGIISVLPKLLDSDEVVQYVSLGAGNTGRKFDLETNLRVAEFKFINWRGQDTIRQNSLFKDYFYLSEETTSKSKYLYLTEKNLPLKFLKGGRNLKSVMSKNKKLYDDFYKKYPTSFEVVRDYYGITKDRVQIEDISRYFEPQPPVSTGR